jgi:hypothetical protein
MHWVPFSTLHDREESDNNGSTDSVINKEAPAQQHLKDTERSPNLLGTCGLSYVTDQLRRHGFNSTGITLQEDPEFQG